MPGRDGPARHLATMHAAREVGGDFYDFYLLDEDKLAFLIADVSGKGIPAAMFMMTGKTVIRDYAERGDAPAEVFRSANEKLCDGNDAGIFITAWMGFLNTKSGLVRFVNAGHNPPILIRDGRAAFISMEADLMLAGMEGTAYEEQRLQMNPGDILFLYTDGVTEAANEQEEMFGEERLLKVLSASFGKGEEACRKICGALKQEIDRFTDGAAQSDDITMLCLYYAGGEEQRDHHAEEMRLEEAGVKQADEVEAFVERFLERENCPQEIRKEIEMAAEEIYVNIAGYAYAPGTGPAVIRIEMQEEPRGAAITFTDRGKPFNPLEKEDPDLSLSVKERPVGGLGIYMARNCMDDVAYEYADGQNILKLFRKF